MFVVFISASVSWLAKVVKVPIDEDPIIGPELTTLQLLAVVNPPIPLKISIDEG